MIFINNIMKVKSERKAMTVHYIRRERPWLKV